MLLGVDLREEDGAVVVAVPRPPLVQGGDGRPLERLVSPAGVPGGIHFRVWGVCGVWRVARDAGNA